MSDQQERGDEDSPMPDEPSLRRLTFDTGVGRWSGRPRRSAQQRSAIIMGTKHSRTRTRLGAMGIPAALLATPTFAFADGTMTRDMRIALNRMHVDAIA